MDLEKLLNLGDVQKIDGVSLRPFGAQFGPAPLFVWSGRVGGGHLSPRRELHERWAACRGLVGSPASTWSAVQGSVASAPAPQRWQVMALARTYAASCLYLGP